MNRISVGDLFKEYKGNDFEEISAEYYERMESDSTFLKDSVDYIQSLRDDRFFELISENSEIPSLKNIQQLVDRQVALKFAKEEYKTVSIFRRILDLILKIFFRADGVLKSQEKAITFFRDAKALPNVGNTCWMNATLQMLRSLPDFQRNHDHENRIKNLIGRIYDRSKQIKQKSLLGRIKDFFVKDKLTIACENLANALHEEMGIERGNQSCPGEFLTQVGRDLGLNPIQMKSIRNIAGSSPVDETGFVLNVGEGDSLQESIDRYFSKEELEGGAGTRQIVLQKAPNNLFVQFKSRLIAVFDGQHLYRGKSHDRLKLDDTVTLNEGGKLVRYEIKDVVVHRGRSAESGHYVCYKKEDDGKWTLYDDSYVSGPYTFEQVQEELERWSYIFRLERVAVEGLPFNDEEYKGE